LKKTGQVISQAQKKKHPFPSTRKTNAQRISQWKAKRNEAVDDSKTCAETQTDDSISITDFYPIVVWVLVVFHQGLFLWCNLGSDLLMLGRPGRMTLRRTPIRL
jgi:hypothetical protein